MFFDFRAVSGFEQRKGVDQHRLVRNQLGCLIELGQRRPGANALIEHGLGLQLHRGRQRRQLIPGPVSTPNGC